MKLPSLGIFRGSRLQGAGPAFGTCPFETFLALSVAKTETLSVGKRPINFRKTENSIQMPPPPALAAETLVYRAGGCSSPPCASRRQTLSLTPRLPRGLPRAPLLWKGLPMESKEKLF